MGAINGRKIMWAGPLFKCGLFRILSTSDVLLKGVFKTISVCNTDAGVCFTKIFVQPDSNIFIVWIPINFIVRAAGKGICTICSPWFIF
jgi:hypothetical protein